MLVLARRKLALADQIGSRALRADAAESLACLWLSLVIVVGDHAAHVERHRTSFRVMSKCLSRRAAG